MSRLSATAINLSAIAVTLAAFCLLSPPAAAITPAITSVPASIAVGASFTINGSGFTDGSVVNFFVATATGAVNFGPLNPAKPISSTQLTVPVPTTVSPQGALFLGEGVVAVQVVDKDQSFAKSNSVTAQLFGDNADGFPNLTGINGIGLSATGTEPGIATDNVEIHLMPGTPVTLNGNGFDTVNGIAVDLFCDCPGGKIPTIFLKPGNAGLTTTALTIDLPATGTGGLAAGPGALVVSNRGATDDYAIKSNAVSVPIGSPVAVTSVTQLGCAVTVNGTGFAVNGSGLPTLTAMNLFNQQGGAAVNLGGLDSSGAPRIPLSITSSTQLTFSLAGTGFAPGPSYVQLLNPPFISFTSSGGPGGAFTAVECTAATPTPTPSAATPSPTPTPIPTTPSPTATPVSPLFSQACSSQTMIGIDPVNNIGYVPVYSLDKAGNAQLAVVDLTVGAASPVLKTISLGGSVQPISVTYNPFNQTILAQARTSDDGVLIYEINTATHEIISTVVATGLVQQAGSAVSRRSEAEAVASNSWSARWLALARALQTRQWAKMRRAEIAGLLQSPSLSNGPWGPVVLQPTSGGIVEDLKNNRAIVAGTAALGILDTSKSPPVWNPHSVVDLDLDAESISLNPDTGLLFISNLGTDDLIDTTKSPLSEIPFQRVPNKGLSDGVAFDSITNIAIHSEFDGADKVYAFNFGTLDITQNPATADPIGVQGLGFSTADGLLGLGPGGQDVINCVTHQAIIADEFWPNFKLVQMPTTPVAGSLDNNGQPGSGTTPDAASVYTIAAAILPHTLVGGIESPLAAIDSPSALTVDPRRNFAYMLADDWVFYHRWTPGSTLPLFLVRVDLSKPVVGASPTGGINGKTFWTPASAVIPLP